MLSNQQFIDPSIAQQMHKLEQEMKRLIETRVNIKNNHKINEQVKERLLRYNEDERVRLRGLMEKGKLAMVEYFDRQVHVISKQCIMKGKAVNINSKSHYQQQRSSTSQQKLLQTTRTRRQSSITTASTNHLTTNIIKQQQLNLSSLKSNSILSQKMRSSHASTHCRTDSRRLEKSIAGGIYLVCEGDDEDNRNIIMSSTTTTTINSNNTNNNKKKSPQLSPSSNSNNNQSIIQQYRSGRYHLAHSDILQVNQFNITNRNIQQQSTQQSLQQSQQACVSKRKLSAYMNYQQLHDSSSNNISPQSMMIMTARQVQQQQQQSHSVDQISQLYYKKITYLQQKCNKLQQQNSQLKKIIQYQEKTIQQITIIIDQKERQLIGIECQFRQREQMYKVKIQQLGGGCSVLGEEIGRVCSELLSNHKQVKHTAYNPLNQYSQIHHHSPSTEQRPFTLTISPELSKSSTTNSHEISFLSKQLLQLQQSLKKIQSQNQQLKGERTLLLKRIKI